MQENFFNTEKPLWLIQIPSLLAAHARSAQVERETHASSQRHTCNPHVRCEGPPSSLQGLNRVSQKGQNRGRTLGMVTPLTPGTLIPYPEACLLFVCWWPFITPFLVVLQPERQPPGQQGRRGYLTLIRKPIAAAWWEGTDLLQSLSDPSFLRSMGRGQDNKPHSLVWR